MNMNPNAQAYLDQGNALYSQGRFEEAISRYARVLEINPRSADAYNNWGFALSAMGRFDEAGAKYSKAIEINPQSSQAYYNWGNALRRQNKQEDAIAKYKKAVEINPNYSLAYNNWGVVLDSQGKYEEAMTKYSQAINTNPGYSQAYNNWGFALDALGKYEESIAKYMKATEIDVNYSDAYDNWGNALSALGRYGEAVLKYSKAISINPSHSEAYYNWGLALYYQSRYDEAAVKFNKAIQINPGYILAHFTLALDLYHLEKYADVQYIRIQTQKLMSSSPNHAIQLSHMVSAEIVRAEKKLARARTEYNKTELTEKVASMKKVLELFVPPVPKEIMPSPVQIQQQQQSPTQSPLQPTQNQKPNYALYPPKELEITRSISPTTSSPTLNTNSPTLNNSPGGGSPTLNPSSPTLNTSYEDFRNSPTLPVINPQSTQKQAFPEPALNDYYEFLSEELSFIFKKIFNVRDNKLEEKYDVLLPILSYVTSCVSPFNSLSYADKVFPFLTKIAPDGLKLEDLLQIKRVNKVASRFVGYFTTFDEVDQIIEKLARDLVALRKDELTMNYNNNVSIKTLDKVKRAKEKGIFSSNLVINPSEELAFMDLNIILILCFLEGLKVPDYFNFNQKISNITNVVTRKMKIFFDNQNNKEEPIFV